MTRVEWTQHAIAYVSLGVVFLAIGAMLDTMLLSLLGGVLVLLVAWDRLQLRMRAPRVETHVEPLRVEEEGRVNVRLTGHRLRPDHQVYVPLANGLRLAQGSNVWIPDGQDQEFELRAEVRGPQSVGPTHVRHWSAARLWARDEVVSREAAVEVVPRSEPVDGFGLLSRVVKPMQGRFTVNRPGQGFDFFTLRMYQTGDTIRDVNWKASARRDEDLVVNQRQLETHSEMLILLDARIISGVGPLGKTPLDRACRVALGLFEEAVAARDTVRFVAYGDGLSRLPDTGGERVLAMESLLAKLPAAGTMSAGQAWDAVKVDMKSHGPVIVLSSCEAPQDLADAIHDMAARGHPVTLLSPRPTGLGWEHDEGRQAAREEVLERVRGRGALVVDWGPEEPVIAEKPRVLGRFM